jgi:hypothetical protein
MCRTLITKYINLPGEVCDVPETLPAVDGLDIRSAVGRLNQAPPHALIQSLESFNVAPVVPVRPNKNDTRRMPTRRNECSNQKKEQHNLVPSELSDLDENVVEGTHFSSILTQLPKSRNVRGSVVVQCTVSCGDLRMEFWKKTATPRSKINLLSQIPSNWMPRW